MAEPHAQRVESDQRMFGNLVDSTPRQRPSRRRILTLQLAVAAHLLVLAAIVVNDYFKVPPIPEPQLAVSFAQMAPPPPPPPPAAPKPAPKQPEPEVEPPTEMTEPLEVPEEIASEPIVGDTTGTGVEGGVAGGVEGGVEGGVPGGATEVFRLGGPATPPQVIDDVKPTYPRLALAARLEGVVILEALIGRDGTVRDVKVLRGMSMGCTEAAVDAVKKRRYKPGMLEGQPVEFALTVTVQFRLSSS
jgi:protein TonB